ncbi:phosphodiesterase [Pseudophaeobacter sp.]|uniref:phosphodiesterase n=1 Tax=Pseudophaeobacter sp. TaxID=1971739 RepID=UPI00329A562A
MLIAQISDTHIAAPGQRTCGVAPMAENLRRVVRHINGMEPGPDLVILTGDVTQAASLEETRLAAEVLSALQMPLHIVPGNHDDRQILSEVFGPDICSMTASGECHSVIEGHPLRLIGLDTLHPGHSGGRISPSALRWLDARLAEGGNQPTVIFAHHPPLRLGVPETDEDGFIGAKDLGALIAARSNIERILCGHIHLHTNTRWQGAVVTTAPSIGMQLTLQPGVQLPSKFWLSEPSFLLHHWTKDQLLVSHPMVLSALPGPFEF